VKREKYGSFAQENKIEVKTYFLKIPKDKKRMYFEKKLGKRYNS